MDQHRTLPFLSGILHKYYEQNLRKACPTYQSSNAQIRNVRHVNRAEFFGGRHFMFSRVCLPSFDSLTS